MIANAVAIYLLGAAWQAPLLAGLTWVLARLVAGADARLRHRLWVACLFLAIGLPVLPVTPLRLPPLAVAPSVTTTPSDVSAPDSPTPLSEPAPAQDDTALLKQWLLALYALALALAAFQLAAGLWRTHLLVRSARPMTLPPEARDAFTGAAATLGVPLPALRTHPRLDFPATLNWPRPQVFLSADFRLIPREDAAAALCHELAHVKRHDFWFNLVYAAAMLPLRYHPAVCWIKRQIDTSREMICDEWAAELTGGKRAYARSLLRFGRRASGRPSYLYAAHPALALGYVTTHPLEDRIVQLLHSAKHRPSHQAVRHAFSATLLASATLALVMVSLPYAEAQAPAAAPNPPAAAPITQEALPPASPAAPAIPASPAVSAGEPTPMAPPAPAAVAAPPSPPPAPDAPPARAATVSPAHNHVVHRWTGADGKPVVVMNDTDTDLTPEEQQRIQREIAAAEASIKAAGDRIAADSAKLQAAAQRAAEVQLKSLDLPKIAREAGEAANKVNDPAFQRRMADLQQRISGEIERKMEDADRKLRDAENKLEHAHTKLDNDSGDEELPD